MGDYNNDYNKHRRNDRNNIIPAEPKQTGDHAIVRAGRLFRGIGAEEMDFCRVMEIIENIRHIIGKQETLEVACAHKANHTLCPFLQKKPPKIRTMKRSVITDAIIAQAMGLSPRELRYLKGRTLNKLTDSLSHSDKILPPDRKS